MGNCAEETAKKHSVSREDQDTYALESYARASKAWSSGAFAAEIAPVTIPDRRGDIVFKEDEEYKNLKAEKVRSLRPVFAKDGTVTAANASKINDGASAVVLASQSKIDEAGLKPLARILCRSSTLEMSDTNRAESLSGQPTPTPHARPLTSLSLLLLPSQERWRRLASQKIKVRDRPVCQRDISERLTLLVFFWPNSGRVRDQRGFLSRRTGQHEDPRPRPGQGQPSRRRCRLGPPRRQLRFQNHRDVGHSCALLFGIFEANFNLGSVSCTNSRRARSVWPVSATVVCPIFLT